MTWSVKEVIGALGEEFRDQKSLDSDLIDMKLFDSNSGIGIGVDSLGQRILVLPGQEGVSSFTTKNADFDPSCRISWLEKDVSLPSTSTLICRSDFKIPSVLEAVAVVFIGLIELQEKFGSAGRAIWEMKELFENGFRTPYSEETLLGLIGEILVINHAEKPNSILKFWHTDPSDSFDFSSKEFRLEVKTSRSQSRNHSFSSNQIGTKFDTKILIASIVLSTVEVGSTLRDLTNEVSEKLGPKDAQIFIERCIGILGCALEFADGLKFDPEASIESLAFINGISVPRPESAPGVISMNWLASLSEVAHEEMNLESAIKRF